jgi:hypothetical protein
VSHRALARAGAFGEEMLHVVEHGVAVLDGPPVGLHPRDEAVHALLRLRQRLLRRLLAHCVHRTLQEHLVCVCTHAAGVSGSAT